MVVICKLCEQDMNAVDTCTVTTMILKDHYGIQMEFDRSRFHFTEESGRCHDCGIKHGEIHHLGCDVERCPRCREQLITCYCWDNDDNASQSDDD